MTTLDQLHYLQSTAGHDLLATLRDLDPQPASGLRIISQLRKQFPAEMVAAGMSMHLLRQRAAAKFTRHQQMWFTRDGYEQATAEPIAAWRAARFAGHTRLADLCCGIGGDLASLATQPGVAHITAVDLDPVHLEMALANAGVYGATASIDGLLANVASVSLAGFDGVFIDPARRDTTGRKKLGDSDPPLEWCLALATTVPAVGIKFAPGLSHQALPDDWELETIATGHDLKEAMLWSPALRHHARQATVIDGETVHTFTAVPGDPVPVRAPEPGDDFYDCNPAITRAGLVDDLARQIGAAKIDEQIAFLVAGNGPGTPFARRFRVLASLPWHERNLKQQIIDLDGGELTIRRRGLPGNVDDIQKRLRGSGKRPLFLAMTRLQDRPWAIICDIPAP